MGKFWVDWGRRWRRWRELPRDYEVLVKEFSEVCARCVKAEESLELERQGSVKLNARVWEMARKMERERAAMVGELPGLTPGEMERLAILAEECGEVARAVGKVLRFGWESQSPYGGRPNRTALEREIGSVRAIVNLMLDADDLHLGDVQAWQRTKRAGLAKWTLYQKCSMPREDQLAMMRNIQEGVQ